LWLNIRMQKTQWIYESPDKGDTVYRRRFGSLQKELVFKKPDPHSISAHVAEIVSESPNDPAIKDMLDKLMVYWSLKNAKN
jgi:hypothetical protein